MYSCSLGSSSMVVVKIKVVEVANVAKVVILPLATAIVRTYTFSILLI